MKRAAIFFAILGFLALSVGCKQKGNDTDGIRLGINQHLSSLKTLNLGAMDMNIRNVSIQGNQAQAQVEFRPKGSGLQGPGMQVSYSLVKQDGNWVVQNSQAAGGAINHPAPGQTPPENSTPSSPAALPDFSNLLHSGTSNSLPPGHPPVNGQANTSSQ